MPKSTASYHSLAPSRDGDEDDDELDSSHGQSLSASLSASPKISRKHSSTKASDLDLRSRLPPRLVLDEHTNLLDNSDGRPSYRSMPPSPRHQFKRQRSTGSMRPSHSRRGSFGFRVARALGADPNPTTGELPKFTHLTLDEGCSKLTLTDNNLHDSVASLYRDDRVWYDQFTSTDWVQDNIADAFRLKELRSRRDFKGRLYALFDAAQGWILVALIGCLTAGVAYIVDTTEAAVFDWKTGYCSTKWYQSKRKCCSGADICSDWIRWSSRLRPGHEANQWIDFAAFVFWVVLLSIVACLVTLQTKTVISSAISLSTLDENLGADDLRSSNDDMQAFKDSPSSPEHRYAKAAVRPPMVYYPGRSSITRNIQSLG